MTTTEIRVRVSFTCILAFLMIRYFHLGGIFLVALLVPLGYIIAPFLAHLLGGKTAELYIGPKRHKEQPIMSRGEAMVKQRRYEEALEEYLQVQEQFPEFLPVYQPLFDLTLRKLQQPEKARELYKAGWMTMCDEDKVKLEKLFKNFNNAH